MKQYENLVNIYNTITDLIDSRNTPDDIKKDLLVVAKKSI